MNKLKLWFLRKFRRIDTSPEQFEIWFERMLGRQLQGGEVYYAIAVKDQAEIPKIGNQWRLFQDFDEADNERKRLQSGNPRITLELRIVRNFYSGVK